MDGYPYSEKTFGLVSLRAQQVRALLKGVPAFKIPFDDFDRARVLAVFEIHGARNAEGAGNVIGFFFQAENLCQSYVHFLNGMTMRLPIEWLLKVPVGVVAVSGA